MSPCNRPPNACAERRYRTTSRPRSGTDRRSRRAHPIRRDRSRRFDFAIRRNQNDGFRRQIERKCRAERIGGICRNYVREQLAPTLLLGFAPVKHQLGIRFDAGDHIVCTLGKERITLNRSNDLRRSLARVVPARRALRQTIQPFPFGKLPICRGAVWIGYKQRHGARQRNIVVDVCSVANRGHVSLCVPVGVGIAPEVRKVWKAAGNLCLHESNGIGAEYRRQEPSRRKAR